MKITIDTDWLRERKYRDAEQEQNYQARLYKQGYNDALDNAIDKLEEWKPETTDIVEVVDIAIRSLEAWKEVMKDVQDWQENFNAHVKLLELTDAEQEGTMAYGEDVVNIIGNHMVELKEVKE